MQNPASGKPQETYLINFVDDIRLSLAHSDKQCLVAENCCIKQVIEHITRLVTSCQKTIEAWELGNLIALRKAKIVYNFGLSECNRVN